MPGKELCREAQHFIASCRKCWDGEITAEPGADGIARLRFPAGADVLVIGAHALGASAWDRIVSVFPRSNVPFPNVSRARIAAIVHDQDGDGFSLTARRDTCYLIITGVPDDVATALLRQRGLAALADIAALCLQRGYSEAALKAASIAHEDGGHLGQLALLISSAAGLAHGRWHPPRFSDGPAGDAQVTAIDVLATAVEGVETKGPLSESARGLLKSALEDYCGRLCDYRSLPRELYFKLMGLYSQSEDTDEQLALLLAFCWSCLLSPEPSSARPWIVEAAESGAGKQAAELVMRAFSLGFAAPLIALSLAADLEEHLEEPEADRLLTTLSQVVRNTCETIDVQLSEGGRPLPLIQVHQDAAERYTMLTNDYGMAVHRYCESGSCSGNELDFLNNITASSRDKGRVVLEEWAAEALSQL